MSLLKHGDGVDFQKASSTLDASVKIYTSRVDSVADDTGKLLNGLAESKSRKGRGGNTEEGEDGEEDGEDGEEGQKKRKRRAARGAESTLAASFEQLQAKKLEFELSVDPLFKKASADLDEGGAKGLLLNQLSIDSMGKIAFDSSDDIRDASEHRDSSPTPGLEGGEGEIKHTKESAAVEEEAGSEDVEIDISSLAREFFPDLPRLDEQYVCPSLQNFEFGDADGTIDLPLFDMSDAFPEDLDQNADDGEVGEKSGLFLDDDNPMGFDDDDGALPGLDLRVEEPGFGEGGEVWARDAAIEPQARVHNMGMTAADEEGRDEDVDDGSAGAVDEAFAADGYQYGNSTQGRIEDQEHILNYFDNALKKNWAGPEHWRVRKIRDLGKTTAPTERKKKEPFEIDFLAPMSQALADALYTPAPSTSAITLPKKDWISKDNNLLPDDKHFNARKLTTYFLRPHTRIGGKGNIKRREEPGKKPGVDEDDAEFWAKQGPRADTDEEHAPLVDYDGEFFQDDGLGAVGDPYDEEEEQFVDARDHQSPPAEGAPGLSQGLDGVLLGTQEGAFSTQPGGENRQFRPEYLQYARRAKKVNVKRLKDELWRGIGFDEVSITNMRTSISTDRGTQDQPAPSSGSMEVDAIPKTPDTALRFTDVISGLQNVYPKQQLDDISTSYCFICLLHLANERGLIITNDEKFEDLTIKRDYTADLSIAAD